MTDEERQEKKRERNRSYYWAHRDEILLRQKKYRAEHLEQCRETCRKCWKKYYAKNREELLAKNRQWAQDHREQQRDYYRKYMADRPEKRQEYNRKRREKRRAIRNGTYFELPEERPLTGPAPAGCTYPDCFHCPLEDCMRESI